jgi:MoaA/NifB/PqqE/SkfB family radical SAM enzyme
MASGSIPFILPRVNDKHLEFKRYLNWLLALMDRRVNAEIAYAMPFEVTIDPSTVCQLSCPYCSVGSGTITRDQGVLRPNIHSQMLRDISDELFIIWYFSTGEPLLNRFLPEIIASTRDKEIYSVISTNLSLKLSDERIEKILSCGLGCISVSIDGASVETYSRYRVGGDFNLVMNNLRRLVERKRAMGLDLPHIEWRFLVFRHNTHEVPRARELATEIGVDLLEFFYGYAPPDASDHEVQPADPIDLNPAVSGPAIERAANRSPTALIRALEANRSPTAQIKAFLSKRSTLVLDSDLRKKCDWLYFGSTLFPNGSVGPCCVSNEEPDDFGKLSEDIRFKDVWNNPLYREARSLWNNKNWDNTKLICARCPNSQAQDYQFRTTLQALLRNAPDWVLKVLTTDPERFFFDLDHKLSPHEFAALLQCNHFLSETFAQERQWLADKASQDKAEVAERIEWMRQALAIPNDHNPDQ